MTWYHLIVASGGQDYFRQLTDFFIQIQYTMGTMFFQFSGKPLFGETNYNDYNFSRQHQYKNYSSLVLAGRPFCQFFFKQSEDWLTINLKKKKNRRRQAKEVIPPVLIF